MPGLLVGNLLGGEKLSFLGPLGGNPRVGETRLLSFLSPLSGRPFGLNNTAALDGLKAAVERALAPHRQIEARHVGQIFPPGNLSSDDALTRRRELGNRAPRGGIVRLSLGWRPARPAISSIIWAIARRIGSLSSLLETSQPDTLLPATSAFTVICSGSLRYPASQYSMTTVCPASTFFVVNTPRPSVGPMSIWRRCASKTRTFTPGIGAFL